MTRSKTRPWYSEPRNEIIAVGFGSERPLVKPDDTAARPEALAS
ncbi:hypothetical protein [Corallococcus sp. CA053C]|nr:hypothetical protein [Corallococcus sp. CA053C]